MVLMKKGCGNMCLVSQGSLLFEEWISVSECEETNQPNHFYMLSSSEDKQCI